VARSEFRWKKRFKAKGLDLKIDSRDVEVWNEAIFLTKNLIFERSYSYASYCKTFRVEFLLENGNLTVLSYNPGRRNGYV